VKLLEKIKEAKKVSAQETSKKGNLAANMQAAVEAMRKKDAPTP
jgi:hypothetical protein